MGEREPGGLPHHRQVADDVKEINMSPATHNQKEAAKEIVSARWSVRYRTNAMDLACGLRVRSRLSADAMAAAAASLPDRSESRVGRSGDCERRHCDCDGESELSKDDHASLMKLFSLTPIATPTCLNCSA
jgi:hypothetical protein